MTLQYNRRVDAIDKTLSVVVDLLSTVC